MKILDRLQKALFVLCVVLAFFFTGIALYTQDRKTDPENSQSEQSNTEVRINWFIYTLPWAFSAV